MSNYYPTKSRFSGTPPAIDFQVPGGVGPDLLGDFLRKRRPPDKGGGARKRPGRPKVSGFRIGKSRIDVGYALRKVAPFALAFDAGYALGWIIFAPEIDPHWEMYPGASYGWAPCGGHQPTQADFELHTVSIAKNLTNNCAASVGNYVAPGVLEAWPHGWPPQNTKLHPGFSSSQFGNFQAFWVNVAGQVRLHQIVGVSHPSMPSASVPWPIWHPASVPAKPHFTLPGTILPTIAPATMPIGQPMEMPMPVPFWALPGFLRPQPGYGPGQGYTAPVLDPVPEVPAVPEPGVVIPIYGVGGGTIIRPRGRQKPRKKEKERKVRFKGSAVLGHLLNGVTEGLDSLMCVHKGLPPKLRAHPKWEAGGEWNWRWYPGGWRKERGKYRAPTAQEDAMAIYKNINDLDIGKVLHCLTANEIEDTLFGILGGAVKKGSRTKPGGVGGWSTGPWDTAFMENVGNIR